MNSSRPSRKNLTVGTRQQGKHIHIHVVFIPTSRDQLIPGLLEGRGDIAAGLLTVTPERLEQVDFGEPFFRGVREIAVTGPARPTGLRR